MHILFGYAKFRRNGSFPCSDRQNHSKYLPQLIPVHAHHRLLPNCHQVVSTKLEQGPRCHFHRRVGLWRMEDTLTIYPISTCNKGTLRRLHRPTSMLRLSISLTNLAVQGSVLLMIAKTTGDYMSIFWKNWLRGPLKLGDLWMIGETIQPTKRQGRKPPWRRKTILFLFQVRSLVRFFLILHHLKFGLTIIYGKVECQFVLVGTIYT